MRGLNNEGAPGPDCILVFFYKDCWDTVGQEVMAALEDFRAGRCHMDMLNRAYIVLLPKVQGADQICEFRPISLSNSLYLIFAKVLTNRLQGVLASLNSPFQSAFIPGRQMTDSMRYDFHLCRFGERSTARGMDSPSTRHQAGMPLAPLLSILAVDALAVCTL